MVVERDFLRLERFWREVLLNIPAEKLTTQAFYKDNKFRWRINYLLENNSDELVDNLVSGKSCKELWESQGFQSATILGWAAIYFHSLGFLLRPFCNQELGLIQVTLSENREVEELTSEQLSKFFGLDEEEADWLFLQEEYDFYVQEYLSPQGTDIVDVCLRFQKFLEIGGLTEEEEFKFVLPF